MERASKGHPMTLQPDEVRQLANVVVGMDRVILEYVVAYGDDLVNELMGVAVNNVVDAEVVDDETETKIGFDGEDERVDSPNQEEE